MAPSRASIPATRSKTTATDFPPNDSDAHAIVAEHSALATARQSLTYLIDPSKADPATRPKRLRTRALLRSLHYFGKFLFWKLYRWAKYAIVGSVMAAVGSMAVAGSLATGVGFLVAPPGILASVGLGTIYGVGKFAWRRIYRKSTGRPLGGRAVDVSEERIYAKEPDLQAVPW